MELRDARVANDRGRCQLRPRPLSGLGILCRISGAQTQSTPNSNNRMTTDSGTPKSQRMIGISRTPFRLSIEHPAEQVVPKSAKVS